MTGNFVIEYTPKRKKEIQEFLKYFKRYANDFGGKSYCHVYRNGFFGPGIFGSYYDDGIYLEARYTKSLLKNRLNVKITFKNNLRSLTEGLNTSFNRFGELEVVVDNLEKAYKLIKEVKN